MCGIVGYIGTRKASTVLINGLQKLEYRGYDSAGIATMENKGISCMKAQGRVNKLYDIDGINDLKGTVGIAHTRWATHGKPSDINAHPHLNNSNTIAVVHNGIIENYSELKEELINEGYKFISQTDTEVIPHLIDKYYKKQNDLLKSVYSACQQLRGSYAIEVISNEHPDKIVVARKDSPMVIGINENEKFIASDIPAVLEYTKEFYLIDDGEFVELTKDDIKFYNKELKEVSKKIENIEWDADAGSKNGYEDYMIKEIFEQPKAIRETIGSRIRKNENCEFSELNFDKDFLKSINKIKMIACGTAMYAGLAAEKSFEEILRIETEVVPASEFRYGNPIIDEHTLIIFITQSGETADTIAALKLAKSKKSKTIAVTNVLGSSITREADYTIYTHAGPEIAVASTKAYTSQVVLLEILALYFAETLEIENVKISELKKDILCISSKVEEVLKLNEKIKKIADKISNEKDVFFIGRGVDYAVTLEASLKLKEVSYIHSDAYSAGELKHGPIALMEKNVNVIAIINDSEIVDKTVSNVQEVITRGADITVITNQEINEFENIIKIPKVDKLISPVLAIIPLQLLAYYVAKDKKLDVDKPRNLAKSVTVE